jgi:hypothetical protein
MFYGATRRLMLVRWEVKHCKAFALFKPLALLPV